MRRAEVRHLLVVEADRLVGIVSHRDWRRVPASGSVADWESQPVARIMIEDPVTMAPETLVTTAARALLERKIGCLPVRTARPSSASSRPRTRSKRSSRRSSENGDDMGIRKSYGKNKKNKRPIGAIAVKREETLRRARRPSRKPSS